MVKRKREVLTKGNGQCAQSKKIKESTFFPLHDLPKDLLVNYIFVFCDFNGDIFNIHQVCKSFHRMFWDTPSHSVIRQTDKVIKEGNLRLLKYLALNTGVDFSADNNRALYLAVRLTNAWMGCRIKRRTKMVNVIIRDDRVNPFAMNGEILPKIVELTNDVTILERIAKWEGKDEERRMYGAQMLFTACLFGKVEYIKFLTMQEWIDPTTYKNEAFYKAIESKNVEALRALLDCCEKRGVDFRSSHICFNMYREFRPSAALLLHERGLFQKISLDGLLLSSAIYDESPKELEKLLKDKQFDPCKIRRNLFVDAILAEKTEELLKVLMKDKRLDPSMKGNEALFRAASSNNHQAMELLLTDNRVDPCCFNHKIMVTLVRQGYYHEDDKCINLLLKDGRVNPAAEDNRAIIDACKRGSEFAVKLLMADRRVDPSARGSVALLYAAKRRNWTIVLELLKDKRVNPMVSKGFVLINVCRYGNDNMASKIVEKILKFPCVDMSVPINEALLCVVKDKKPKTMKLILTDQRVNPSFSENKAMRIACKIGFHEGVEILLGDNRLDLSIRSEEILILACICGHKPESVFITRKLLEDGRIDPSSNNNFVIMSLLRRSIGSYIDRDAFNLLFKDKRTQPVLSYSLEMAKLPDSENCYRGLPPFFSCETEESDEESSHSPWD